MYSPVNSFLTNSKETMEATDMNTAINKSGIYNFLDIVVVKL